VGSCDQPTNKSDATNTVKRFLGIHGRPLYLVGFALVVASVQPGAQQTAGRRPPASSWVLTWSDEFNGPDGSAPDPAKWSVESGGNGWGNSEMQYYTPRRENVRQEKGSLVIEAIKEKFTGPDGTRRDYTSGRLKTEGRAASVICSGR
jgi:beta-glucanase (GH16 family)